jgi:hypothetical protein
MRALGERGYIQGQNLEFQPFGAAGMPLSRLPEFAQDIAANKFDAAVVAGYPPAAAMKGTGVPTVVGSGAGDDRPMCSKHSFKLAARCRFWTMGGLMQKRKERC